MNDDDLYLADIRHERQPHVNEIHLSEGVTVLLGLTPIDVPRPASLRQEIIVETLIDERYNRELSHRASADAMSLYSRGQLFAISNRVNLKRDDGGKVTVRLFKNRTTLF